MKVENPVIRSVNIRLNGSVTVIERDTDGGVLSLFDVLNPDGIEPDQLASWCCLSDISAPLGCNTVTARKRADNTIVEADRFGDVLKLVEQING